MNTLPTDLINLIQFHTRASENYFLGLDASDSQPYLDLVRPTSRLKLAIKNNNVGWIFQMLDFMKSRNYMIDQHQMDRIVHKTNLTWILGYLKMLPNASESYYYYYHGKEGDESIINDNTKDWNIYMFIEGLAKSQHYDLYEKYSSDPDKLVRSLEYVMHFNDEDYIINRFKKLFSDQRVPMSYLDRALQKNRLKVAQYLLTLGYIGAYNSICRCFVVHLGLSLVDYYGIDELQHLVYQACIDSNINVLASLFNNAIGKHQVQFKRILSTALITPELHEFAQKTFDLKTVLDSRLVKTIKKLRIYMDDYNRFYMDYGISSNTSHIFNFIVGSLLYEYADRNDMNKYKAVYDIAMRSNLLNYKKLDKFTNNNIMFSLSHRVYIQKDIKELKLIAKQLGVDGCDKMRKHQLLATLMSYSC